MRSQLVPSLLDRFFADFDDEAQAAHPFRPAVDLIEHPDRYEVVADLPGIAQKDVEVEFANGVLQIRGEREALQSDARYFRQERASGRFGRAIAFRDDVQVDHIDAAFRDGVLRVTVPKSEKLKPRQVPIAVH